MSRLAEPPGKEVVRRHSEQMVCPRSKTGEAAEATLCSRQVEKASEGIWGADIKGTDRTWVAPSASWTSLGEGVLALPQSIRNSA